MSTQVEVLEARGAAAQAGERIYERHLRTALERAHGGRIVMIHIPSRDYFIGDSLIEVSDQLRRKYSDAGKGEVYARGIGQRAFFQARTPRVAGQ